MDHRSPCPLERGALPLLVALLRSRRKTAASHVARADACVPHRDGISVVKEDDIGETPLVVYLATDASGASAASERLSRALGEDAAVILLHEVRHAFFVKLLVALHQSIHDHCESASCQVLRRVEGTHSYVFAPLCLAGHCELSLPHKQSERIRDELEDPAADVHRARREALFDLFALSMCESHSGSAGSMFSVVGRLWAGICVVRWY